MKLILMFSLLLIASAVCDRVEEEETTEGFNMARAIIEMANKTTFLGFTIPTWIMPLYYMIIYVIQSFVCMLVGIFILGFLSDMTEYH